MKKQCLALCGFFAILFFVLIWITTPSKECAYIQDYTPGEGNIKGNVDTEFWTSLGEEFEIGANKEGYAVFKNPRKAIWKLYRDYGEGIKRIKQGENLGPYFLNYSVYAAYGVDIPLDDPHRNQVGIVCRFADIYENSFEGL